MLYILFRGAVEIGLMGEAEPEAVFGLFLFFPVAYHRLPFSIWAVAIGGLLALAYGLVIWSLGKKRPNLKALRKLQVPFMPFISFGWVLLYLLG